MMIYLDNSATTEPDESVLASFMQVSKRFFANPSSLHHLGTEAAHLLQTARTQVADTLGVAHQEVVFTSGGTEGNNLAIKGIALQHQGRGKHLITTTIEHPSVLETCRSLEALGFEVTYLPVDQTGAISLTALEAAIRTDTILISIMHVNNELGSLQPIKAIGAIAKKYPKLFFHVDDVQGFGKIPLTLRDSGIDLCTISGHKIHGLNGTGVLYVREQTALAPLFHGGNQEQTLRSGTENLAGAVALARAMRLIKEDEQTKQTALIQLRTILVEKLSALSQVVINTPPDGAPHILNVSVPGVRPEALVHLLAERAIYISTTSACSSKQAQSSHVLRACSFAEERVRSAVRISLSYHNTLEDISLFVAAFFSTIEELSKPLE